MAKSKPAKPQKRRGDNFPLFLRSDGRWAKKINGQQRYFGRDKAEAHRLYNRHIGVLQDGIEPSPDDPTLRLLFNSYLAAQEAKMKTGEFAARTLSDSVSTLKSAVKILDDRIVSTLASADFSKLKAQWSKGRGLVTVAGDIRRLKAAFNWAFDQDPSLIERLPKYGKDFRPAPKRVFELAKSRRAALVFEPDELRTLLEKANPQLRAMIYLGANAALWPIDIARLEFEDIDRQFHWLRQPRQKTGVDRAAALWPETAAAIKAAIAIRSKAASPDYQTLIFLTETGRPVVRATNVRPDETDPAALLAAHNVNRIGHDFRDLQKACKLYRVGRGFNALRHGFLTIAESGGDFVAVARVLGHAIPGASSHYREYVGEDRIKAVCELVRQWLFSAKPRRIRKTK